MTLNRTQSNALITSMKRMNPGLLYYIDFLRRISTGFSRSKSLLFIRSTGKFQCYYFDGYRNYTQEGNEVKQLFVQYLNEEGQLHWQNNMIHYIDNIM